MASETDIKKCDGSCNSTLSHGRPRAAGLASHENLAEASGTHTTGPLRMGGSATGLVRWFSYA
jgi:hypothetical protein